MRPWSRRKSVPAMTVWPAAELAVKKLTGAGRCSMSRGGAAIDDAGVDDSRLRIQ